MMSFIIMTALGAYIRIPLPFTPVPITLQTFFVLLCGAVLGRKLGFIAQLSYVALGTLGAPLFQGYGAGLLYLLGPTGGYLIGFVIASFVVGALIDRSAKSPGLFYVAFSMTIGLLVIYACGVLRLAAICRLTIAEAFSLGVIPFVPGALFKIAAASWIYSKIKTKTDGLIK
ncbi:MAG: biotin transporter BioY [Candidatus Omnitrophica bacterium]|nr:biotin transporter BioY [Candidatus Omnitrophota bacterium]